MSFFCGERKAEIGKEQTEMQGKSTVDPRMSSLDLFNFLRSIILANVKPEGGRQSLCFSEIFFKLLSAIPKLPLSLRSSEATVARFCGNHAKK